MTRFLMTAADGGNPSTPQRFDGTTPNDPKTTRLLAVLTSCAADHTADRVTRKMLQVAAADLFDAAARLERLGACGSPHIEGRAQVLAVAHG